MIQMFKLAERDFKATIITMCDIKKKNIYIVYKKAKTFGRER